MLQRILFTCEQTQKELGELKEIVCGNGNPSKGLVVRIDRLEQSVGIVRKMFWVSVGAVLTPASIGGLIYYLLSQHN
jgi:hypothetical protein